MSNTSEADPARWRGREVLVTGGASFIGAALSRRLVALGARVTIADNLSAGALSNLQPELGAGHITFINADLRDLGAAIASVRHKHVVFHLAAEHGGRGHLQAKAAACSTNLTLDGTVIRAAHEAGVEKLIFASSAGVYPVGLQKLALDQAPLSEEMVGPPYEPDGLYGCAKLMAELTLRAYHDNYGFNSVCCRYFTVYGPAGRDTHAIPMMIQRALRGDDPFDVWGDGRQVRDFVYIDDVVRGTLLAAEAVGDASAVNFGSGEPSTLARAARSICGAAGYEPELRFLEGMPSGPMVRVADVGRARSLLGWAPRTSLEEGISHTVQWHRRALGKAS
jgi:nucleoside-diphosphate-sugar epimerase